MAANDTPQYTNVSIRSVESFFQTLITRLNALIARAGGGQALFAAALKIAQDALSQPGGAAKAMAIIGDILKLVDQGLAAEQVHIEQRERELQQAKEQADAKAKDAAKPSQAPAKKDG